MQLLIMISTFFILITVALITFRYTIMTHEIVQTFYQKEKERFDNESKLFYMIGIFLEDAKMRDTILTMSTYSFCHGVIQGSFVLEKADTVAVRCGSLTAYLSQHNVSQKIMNCKEWFLEIMY